jgi:pyrimidine-nucleoside phosphorylase
VDSNDPRAVVATKREGRAVDPKALTAFVLGYARGEIPDAVAAAFLMAALLNGLNEQETLAMTEAMLASGDTVAFPNVRGPKVDKHSTGGVADGVTLVFAPIAASLGLVVAKLSGRGLGHTGGTLDKLESIPGLRTDLTPAELERQVEEIGCAVAAQSANLVPADGKLYALRDATATVPSIPLIAASVMSKKLAVETDLILLDVKVGSGAFMKTPDEAVALARACLVLARGRGRRARAAVTDMSQPLGDAIGNALDVLEAVRLLRGEVRGRLRELSLQFAAAALEDLQGAGHTVALERATRALDEGDALERFRQMVARQGGDPRVADDPAGVLPAAHVVAPLVSDRSGTVASFDAQAIGLASGALGAGRIRKDDTIDPAVGVILHPKVGDAIEVGERIGEIHARSESDAKQAAARILAAFTVADEPVEPPPLVHGWYDAGDGAA